MLNNKNIGTDATGGTDLDSVTLTFKKGIYTIGTELLDEGVSVNGSYSYTSDALGGIVIGTPVTSGSYLKVLDDTIDITWTRSIRFGESTFRSTAFVKVSDEDYFKNDINKIRFADFLNAAVSPKIFNKRMDIKDFKGNLQMVATNSEPSIFYGKIDDLERNGAIYQNWVGTGGDMGLIPNWFWVIGTYEYKTRRTDMIDALSKGIDTIEVHLTDNNLDNLLADLATYNPANFRKIHVSGRRTSASDSAIRTIRAGMGTLNAFAVNGLIIPTDF